MVDSGIRHPFICTYRRFIRVNNAPSKHGY